MRIRVYNERDRIRHLDPFSAKHDFRIDPPKGEAPHNRRARLRQVGVSRTGKGIARIMERKKELKDGR
jgi:hypothetical protein